MSDRTAGRIAMVVLVCVITLITVGGCYLVPKYNVYKRELDGKAMLKEAEWSRQIAVEEARAKDESADLEASAEIKRAQGVAEANRSIGNSLKGNEGYLRYLWIQGLQDGSSEVIYIPTEANLPILEARDKPHGN
jgi:hypothetical protein